MADKLTIQEVHAILYEMLCYVDDACRKEGVNYMLGGGTLLGAVRNHGFIPWDDDIDLAVWAQDYPAMRKALKQHLPAHLRLVEPEDYEPYFWDFVIRVQDTRYHWCKPFLKDQNYISIDIFLVNYTSNTIWGVKLYAFFQKSIYALAIGHRYSNNFTQYHFAQREIIKLLSAIGKHIPLKLLHKWYKSLNQHTKNVHKRYCSISNNIPAYMGLPYESIWFEGTTDMYFEGRKFPVQIGYHQKLSLQYGNYMVPQRDSKKYIVHIDCAVSDEDLSDHSSSY